MMRRFLPALMCGLCAAGPASAELYKWVDEGGVVNYGDKPPAGALQVRSLDEDRSSVSVVPGLSKEELERQRKSVEQARIERLERELADLQRAPAPVAQAQESTTYYPGYYGYYGVPTRTWPRQPEHRPSKPQPPKLPIEPPAPPLYSPKGK